MQELTQEQKNKIIAVLNEINAVQGCPRCGNDSFVLLDYIFNQSRRLRPEGIPQEPKIPSILVVCERCGYISQHALGILEGLMKDRV